MSSIFSPTLEYSSVPCFRTYDIVSINGESFRLKDKRKAGLLGKTTNP